MTEIKTQVGRFAVRDSSCDLPVDAHGDVTLTTGEWGAYDLRAAIVVFNDAPEVGGPEVKFARKTLGLKQKDFARVLRVNEFTVSDWERGAASVTPTVQRLIYEILRHVEHCGAEVLESALAERPKPPADGVLEVPKRMCG